MVILVKDIKRGRETNYRLEEAQRNIKLYSGFVKKMMHNPAFSKADQQRAFDELLRWHWIESSLLKSTRAC